MLHETISIASVSLSLSLFLFLQKRRSSAGSRRFRASRFTRVERPLRKRRVAICAMILSLSLRLGGLAASSRGANAFLAGSRYYCQPIRDVPRTPALRLCAPLFAAVTRIFHRRGVTGFLRASRQRKLPVSLSLPPRRQSSNFASGSSRLFNRERSPRAHSVTTLPLVITRNSAFPPNNPGDRARRSELTLEIYNDPSIVDVAAAASRIFSPRPSSQPTLSIRLIFARGTRTKCRNTARAHGLSLDSAGALRKRGNAAFAPLPNISDITRLGRPIPDDRRRTIRHRSA